MKYKTIATFKYNGRTISVRKECVFGEKSPAYLIYDGRRMYSGWRYLSKKDALSQMLSAINEICHI